MSIRLKQISKTVSEISVGREKVGRIVTKYDGTGFYGVVTYQKSKIESNREFRTEVWDDLVRGINRIALCGRNDAELAKAALAKNNEQVRKEAENWNKLFSGSEWHGLMNMRTRTSKVAI